MIAQRYHGNFLSLVDPHGTQTPDGEFEKSINVDERGKTQRKENQQDISRKFASKMVHVEMPDLQRVVLGKSVEGFDCALFKVQLTLQLRTLSGLNYTPFYCYIFLLCLVYFSLFSFSLFRVFSSCVFVVGFSFRVRVACHSSPIGAAPQTRKETVAWGTHTQRKKKEQKT